MGQGAWGSVHGAGRERGLGGARLAWKGGTEYRPPTVVPKRYSQKMSGVKTALTTARPAAPAQRQSTHSMLRQVGSEAGARPGWQSAPEPTTSAHASFGEMRPAATGRKGLLIWSIST